MDFRKLAKGVEKEVIAIRRDIHEHAEPPFEEVRTSALVEKHLKSLGIKTRRMAGTGIAGYLDVKGARRRIALRADMDALPIREETGLPYASRGNAMHACGHDAHTAMLLGVARVLSENRSELPGSVRFIFQPAEEFPPGGAKPMVDEGVMEGVDEVYGVHVGSKIAAGRIIADAGPRYANVDDLRVKVIGVGAHGASPEYSVDPVLTAAEAITSLQQIVARNISPVESGVISVCMINAGSAYNIIPETCFFRGTIRTFTKEMRARMPRMIRRVVDGVCRAHGARFEMEYLKGYDALANSPRQSRAAQETIADLFGRNAVAHEGPRMGAEDFSEYLKVAAGCFMGLGMGDAKKGTDVAHHNPRFKVNEGVLWMGTALLARLAVERGAAAR